MQNMIGVFFSKHFLLVFVRLNIVVDFGIKFRLYQNVYLSWLEYIEIIIHSSNTHSNALYISRNLTKYPK